MTATIPARWYFDVISPYAYLYFRRLGELHPALAVEPVPVLFAGLLKHWDNKGPAELPPKRLHTYRNCVWLARRHGIPLHLPPRHPFNPLHVQRLLLALGADRAAIATAFDFIWRDGRDAGEEWPALCAALGVSSTDAAAMIVDPEVKQRLGDNTANAAATGVFGVPTLSFRGENFWGCDTIEWANAFVDEPSMFASGEMQRAASIEVGAQRKESR